MKAHIFKKYFYLCIVFLVTCIILNSSYSFGQSINSIKRDIIPDAGITSSFWEGKSGKAVIIFEENHISRIGQIELALMLTRLHNRYNINIVALEGAFIRDGVLATKWFYNLPSRYFREEVALQLLREGEINAAEFISLAIPEVKVYGVENKEEYTFEISDLDEKASIIYLYAIAEKLFPKDEDKIREANKLIEEFKEASNKDKPEKLKKLMDYIINANQWTKERYKKLTMKDRIISIEKILFILREIKEKAKEVNAEVGQYENNFNRLIEFYERASRRTNTIITNTLKLLGKKRIPIALIIGAAHTAKAS